ncbi:sensor domain-containing diguanylate cyclase [Pseudomonas rhodesiae]|uniref:sensor domain-containing diguanylate cyclase n=1 Tax=Pseudomonas rhodesiae TaxID=76760 RepID=UPI002897B7A9|nr:sensor domain-containing diguanylate cyclase [Pseudomonas rhodesiae]
MSSKVSVRIDLRRLILLLSVVVSVATLANALYSAYKVQKQQLIDSTIEANRVYAAKLSVSIEQFLYAAQQQVSYSARILGAKGYDHELATLEAERLRRQTDSFNSVTMVSAGGYVIAVSPETIKIKGAKLKSPGAIEALRERRPLISKPYVSAAGNLVVIVSSPVFSESGRYLGYVGGTIYLRQKSILHDLIGVHFYRDESYIYIVDSDRVIIYHPDKDRIGTVEGNAVVDKVVSGADGGTSVINSLGVEMLAGYASIKSVGWGVVSQQSSRKALLPVDTLIYQTVLGMMPVAVLGIFGIFWLAGFISRPLRQLADCARTMEASESVRKITNVGSWYFESAQIKRALLQGLALMQDRIGRLNREVQTDPMTGLLNRRALSGILDLLRSEVRPFSVVTLDIDHFKRVNDTYGHDIGDLVLVKLSEIIRSCSRDGDYSCRLGGEEFLVLLPNVSLSAAAEFAERLRGTVASSTIDVVGSITVSLGVAHWPGSADEISDALKIADEEMYRAKQQGRNRVSVRRLVCSA